VRSFWLMALGKSWRVSIHLERKAFKVQCRLDYFLISNELNSFVSDFRIVFTPNTDHSAVQLNLILEESKQKKGPGFWKFNNSLLEDNRYVSQLRENFPQFKSTYQNVEDLGLRWDLIKMEIRLKLERDATRKSSFKIKSMIYSQKRKNRTIKKSFMSSTQPKHV